MSALLSAAPPGHFSVQITRKSTGLNTRPDVTGVAFLNTAKGRDDAGLTLQLTSRPAGDQEAVNVTESSRSGQKHKIRIFYRLRTTRSLAPQLTEAVLYSVTTIASFGGGRTERAILDPTAPETAAAVDQLISLGISCSGNQKHS